MPLMSDHILSILIAFAAYSLMDLGKAVQKIGVTVIRSRRRRGLIIWIAASAATSAASFLILFAAGIGSVVVIGAMAGTGLVTVTLFSVLYLKESIGKIDFFALAAVMIAPFLFAGFHYEMPATLVAVEHLLFFLGAVCLLFSLLLIPLWRNKKVLGIVSAACAGAFGGMVVMFQKVSASPLGKKTALIHFEIPDADPHGLVSRGIAVLQILTNPYALGWVALSLISTAILQFSYGHGSTIRIIPAFNCAYILVPILGGTLVFQEPLHFVQWIGVVFILGGVLILSFGRKKSAVSDGSEAKEISAHR